MKQYDLIIAEFELLTLWKWGQHSTICPDCDENIVTVSPFSLSISIFLRKAHSDGLHKMHWKIALNFAYVKCSEIEMSLSTAFYAANYAGLNEP